MEARQIEVASHIPDSPGERKDPGKLGRTGSNVQVADTLQDHVLLCEVWSTCS